MSPLPRILIAVLALALPPGGARTSQAQAPATRSSSPDAQRDSVTPGRPIHERGRLLARAAQALGANDTAAALASYDTILAAEPNEAATLYQRGYLRYNHGDENGGLGDLRRSAALGFNMAQSALDMIGHPYAGGGANASGGAVWSRVRDVLQRVRRPWWYAAAALVVITTLLWRGRRKGTTMIVEFPMEPGERQLWFGRSIGGGQTYAVSTRRIIVADGDAMKIQPLEKVPRVLLVEHDDGTGTIGFFSSSAADWSAAQAELDREDPLKTPLALGAERREQVRKRLADDTRLRLATLRFEHVVDSREAFAKSVAAIRDVVPSVESATVPSSGAVADAGAPAPSLTPNQRRIVVTEHSMQRAMGALICVGLILFGVVGTALAGFPQVTRYLSQRAWPGVACDITSTQTFESSDQGPQVRPNLRYRYRYHWEATWQYDFGGRHHVGRNHGYANASAGGVPEHLQLSARLAQLAPGAHSTCWVNPANPAESILDNGFQPIWLLGLAPLVLAAAGAAGLVWVLRRRSSGAAPFGRDAEP